MRVIIVDYMSCTAYEESIVCFLDDGSWDSLISQTYSLFQQSPQRIVSRDCNAFIIVFQQSFTFFCKPDEILLIIRVILMFYLR